MPRSRRMALPLVLVLVAAAPASAVEPRVLRLTGGTTTFAPRTALPGGVSLIPIGDAHPDGDGVRLPVSLGRLDRRTGLGSVNHRGGLRFLAGSRSVDLNNLRFRLDARPDVTAQIGSGERRSVAVLDLAEAQVATTAKRFSASDVAVRLRASAAAAIDQALGTEAVGDEEVLGTAAVEARIRR